MRQRSTLGHMLFEDWADNDAGNGSDRTHEEIRAGPFAHAHDMMAYSISTAGWLYTPFAASRA
jgi:hypothetical protein